MTQTEGKTRIEHVREDMIALAAKLERDLSILLKIADKQAERDIEDDPLIKSIHDAAKLGLELDAPDRKDAQLCKVLNAVDKLMASDFARIEGQEIRALILPYQNRLAEISGELRSLSLSGFVPQEVSRDHV